MAKPMRNRVQLLDPVRRRWVKVDTATGVILARKRDAKPWRRVVKA